MAYAKQRPTGPEGTAGRSAVGSSPGQAVLSKGRGIMWHSVNHKKDLSTSGQLIPGAALFPSLQLLALLIF